MKLCKLKIKDKPLFNKFLRLTRHDLSVYAFENIYIWRPLFDIYWAVVRNNLCVFLKDKIGCFLYLPPLGEKIDPQAVDGAFKIMDGVNSNKEISRIENIEKSGVSFYEDLGYKCSYKSSDYLCLRTNLAGLRGNRFKSQRAVFNYFRKHYNYEYLQFSPKYKRACLELYGLWAVERMAKTKDKIYQGMISDSRGCLKILLRDYTHLNITGRIVKIGDRIKAFTFGFPINPDTFCILYEIADLSVKGLAQFIFRRFCRELSGYKYINIMDDSGLENLKQVKLSYHPEKLIPAYIITRKNG